MELGAAVVLVLLAALASMAVSLLSVRRLSLRGEALAAAARRYAAVIETASDAVITTDDMRRIVGFNSAAVRLLGCRSQDAIGTPVDRFVPEPQRAAHARHMASFGDHGGTAAPMSPVGRDLVALHADGHQIPVEASISVLTEPGPDGPRKLYTVVMRDISQRKAAEAELRRTQASLIEAQRIARLGYFTYDLGSRTWSGSASMLELMGRPPGTTVPSWDMSMVHADDRARVWRHLNEEVFARREPFDLEFRIIRGDDGEVRWLHARGQVHDDGQGRITHLFGSVQDVTERIVATQALERQREELRRLSAALTEAREQERRHVARELHDELGQRLSALKLDLATLLPQLGPQAGAAERDRLRAILGEVDGALAATRRIATDLRPAMLDDLGLTAAIEWLAEDWARRSGVKISLACEPVDDSLSDAAVTTVYRVVQEGLTNVTRHADATQVEVELRREEPDLVLRIADDGHGLEPGDTDKRGSNGLAGIRERARLLGGSASLLNRPGGGCLLEVRLPLERIGSRPGQVQVAA